MGRSSNGFTNWVGGYINGGQSANPETKLFTAVLSQAVHDVFSGHVDRIDRNQALDFLTNNSFQLRIICELAGRAADYVRKKIRKKLLDEL